MSTEARDILDTILGKLKTLTSTESVIGEPVQLGDVTLVPVIKLSLGFGAGGGEGAMEDGKPGKGAGGGGGGGASVTPVGFIVWDGHEVRFIGIGKGKIESLVESVPELLKKFGITGKGKGSGKGGGHSSASQPASDEAET